MVAGPLPRPEAASSPGGLRRALPRLQSATRRRHCRRHPELTMSGTEQELADALREIAMLREELAETNQGVVALYAELDDKAEELRQVSDLKSRFLSYMSHEFRTPLVSIQSMSRLLLERYDGPLSGEQEKQVAFIQACSAEMSEMVDDLLDLAKIEAGRITISPDWFELIDLFSALRGMFNPIATSATVEVVFEEP